MQSETIGEFLAGVRVGVLVTLDAAWLPVPVPLWYDWDGDAAWMFSFRDTAKVRRLQHDERAWLTIAAAAHEPEDWVTLIGTVELLSDGWQVARRLAARYWDLSQESPTQMLARWESRASELVAMRLVPGTCKRLAATS